MVITSVNRIYVEKIVSDIEKSVETISRYTSKPYEYMSEAEKHAVRYNIIVIAEAIVALAIHISRRLYNVEPETSTHALLVLRDRGLLTESEYGDLVRLVRMRNLLVHRYWVIDDEKIYVSVKNDFKSVVNLVKRIQEHV